MQAKETTKRTSWGLYTTVGNKIPIPLKSLDVSACIIHNVAEVTLTQVYQNKSATLLECEFFFPISPEACFNSFEARFGNAVLKGIIKEKEQAREEYKEALEKGHMTAYSEINADTSDIMKVLIGNIPPKTEVSITYSYIQKLDIALNKFWCFRLFSTITPRYNGDIASYLDHDLEILSRYPTISPDSCEAYPWNIKIELQSPSPIKFLACPSHEVIKIFGNENHTCTVTFHPNGIYKPNKDFVLLFSNGRENMLDYVMTPFDDGYCAMVTMVADFKQELSEKEVYVKFSEKLELAKALKELNEIDPMFQQDNEDDESSPSLDAVRGEYIFLLDRSGSMKGDRISMARNALLLFLKSLPADSYFNIVSFGTDYVPLFGSSVAYSKDSLRNAAKMVAKFDSNMGGTHIYNPLQEVLEAPLKKGYPRFVFLLTDGDVSNTQQVLLLVSHNSHRAKVFTIGVGSGCSPELITKAAHYGRGKHEFVADEKDIYEKVINLLNASLSPCFSDLTLHAENFDALVKGVSPNPQRILSFMEGEPLTLFFFIREAAFENQEGKMKLELQMYDSHARKRRSLNVVLDVKNAIDHDALPKLALHDMMRRLDAEKNELIGDEKSVMWLDKEEITSNLIEMSILYGILCKETAFSCELTEIFDVKQNLKRTKVIVPSVLSQDYLYKKSQVHEPQYRALTAKTGKHGSAKVIYEKMRPDGGKLRASEFEESDSKKTNNEDDFDGFDQAPLYLRAIMKQNLDGCFDASDKELQTLVLNSSNLPPMPEGLQAVEQENIWMTILVLVWLEVVCAENKKAWRLVYQKGCDWLKTRNVVNLEKVKDLAKNIIKPL